MVIDSSIINHHQFISHSNSTKLLLVLEINYFMFCCINSKTRHNCKSEFIHKLPNQTILNLLNHRHQYHLPILNSALIASPVSFESEGCGSWGHNTTTLCLSLNALPQFHQFSSYSFNVFSQFFIFSYNNTTAFYSFQP